LSFLLSLIDGRSTSALGGLRSASATVLSPMQNLAFSISSPVVSFFGDWSEVGSKDERISALEAQNDALRRQIAGSKDARRRVKELDSLLNTAGLGNFRIVAARVMSIGSASGFGATALIDAGSADGIKVNMTVIAGAGMVGRVLAVTNNSATVLLIVDSTSTVGARVAVGDRLVSYGVKDGIFVPGVPLGTVTKVRKAQGTNGQLAYVDPFADITALDLVGVIVNKPRTDPRDSLLPEPKPSPTVTVTVTVAPGDGAFAVKTTATPKTSTTAKATASSTSTGKKK
jgi:rod shape-determining protein MreC